MAPERRARRRGSGQAVAVAHGDEMELAAGEILRRRARIEPDLRVAHQGEEERRADPEVGVGGTRRIACILHRLEALRDVAGRALDQKLDLPALLGISLILAGVLVINLFSKTVAH